MCSDQNFSDAFAKFGNSSTVLYSVMKNLNEYTCKIYGQKKCNDLDVARLRILEGKSPSSKSKKALEKIISFDPITLPPCTSALEPKIM